MGRMLRIEEFGTLNVLLSILNVYTVPTTTITMVISRYFAYYHAKKEDDKLRVFFRKSLLFVVLFSISMTVIALLFSYPIKYYLRIDNYLYIFITIFIGGISLITPLSLGPLQGLKDFSTLGTFNFIGAFFKLITGMILVYLGFSIFGALGGILLGSVMLLLVGYFALRKYLTSTEDSSIDLDIQEIIRYVYPVLVCNLSLVMLTNIDLFMVKHYFDAIEAGLYSSAVLFGRIVFYVSSAIVTAMFPIVVQANAKEDSSFDTLKKSLIYSGLFSLICIIGIFLFPKLTVSILFGSHYIRAIPYFKLISIAILPICLLSVLMNYFLAVGKTKVIAISMAFGSLLEIVLIFYFHKTIEEILLVMLFSGLFVVVINFIYLFLYKNKISKSMFL
jgi:O-antigen/teichoic acid export membrane protein